MSIQDIDNLNEKNSGQPGHIDDHKNIVRGLKGVKTELEGRLSEAELNGTYAPIGAVGGGTVVVGDDLTRSIGVGSSTMQLLGPDIQAMLTRYGLTYSRTFTSFGGWQMSHLGAAVGTRPLVTGAFTIPASGSVVVSPTNMPESNNASIAFSVPGAFGGVAGTLASPASSSVWTFTRAATGTAQAIATGTPFIPSTPGPYSRGIALLNPGKNTITASPSLADWSIERVIGMTERMYEHFGGADGRVLVLGHFMDTASASGSPHRAMVAKFNAHFAEKLGKRFLDVSAYLTGTQVWTDTGITPTTQDTEQQTLGNKPLGLSTDNQHLNQTAIVAVTALIEARMLELGWLAPLPVGPFETVVAADNFNRTDGPLGSTSTGAIPWTIPTGSAAAPTIASNAMKNTEAVVRRGLVDVTPTDYQAEAVIKGKGATPGASDMCILARCTSSSNYYYLVPRYDASTPGVGIYKNVGGTVTPVVRSEAAKPVVGQRLALRANGTQLSAYLDGVLILGPTADSDLPTGEPGLMLGSNAVSPDCAWDDFAVKV